MHQTSLNTFALPKMEADDLKAYINENKVLLIPFLNDKFMEYGGIDLAELDPMMRDAFIHWLIVVQERRLRSGAPLLVTLDIVKRFPGWRALTEGMPYRRIRTNSITRKRKNSKIKNRR